MNPHQNTGESHIILFHGQPLTAPTVIPEIKYFCTNGYRKMIGPVATTAVAIFNVLDGRSATLTFAPATEFFSAFAVLMI